MKKGLLVGLATLLMSLGLASCAENGKTPYIGENGNWWIGNTDTGVTAQGPAGEDGADGQDGKDGTSVTVVSVTKVSSVGLVDTYRIVFSDGTQTTFTVTNGESSVIESIELTSSSGLVDTYTITFTNGSTQTFTVTNGEDGEDLTITSIELKSSEGLIDTYVINYSDGSKFEFVVSNGEDGLTPYIGDNGNWWIGETDTGVLADWEKANNIPLTIWSSGLTYKTMTIGEKHGYVVTGWDDDCWEEHLLYELAATGMTPDEIDTYIDNLEDELKNNSHLVIPNYIGHLPVIGVDKNAKLDFSKVTLSNKTIYIGESAFADCLYLKEIDFNNSKIKTIPYKGFYNTSLTSIVLPDTVTSIFDDAFNSTPITSINLDNIKYFGDNALDDAFLPYVYLTKNVEYVGDDVFDGGYIYIEHDIKPSSWGNIGHGTKLIAYGAKKNSEYIYSVTDNKVTLYQYLGETDILVVPALVGGKPVTTIGTGFGSSIFDDDILIGKTAAEKYQILKGISCGFREIVVGNNVEKIEEGALMNGNLLIYLEDSVEEVCIPNNDNILGAFNGYDIDDGAPFSLIVLEDDSSTMFNVDGVIMSFSNLLTIDEDYEIFFKVNIDYDDIFFDESNDIYYKLNLLSYELIAYKNNYVDYITIPNTFNTLPVNIIGKFAFTAVYFNKLAIGSNVERIRTKGFYACTGKIFIPNTVSVINANGFSLESGSQIYTNASAKKDDWDSSWNTNSTPVNYSTSKAEFDNL